MSRLASWFLEAPPTLPAAAAAAPETLAAIKLANATALAGCILQDRCDPVDATRVSLPFPVCSLNLTTMPHRDTHHALKAAAADQLRRFALSANVTLACRHGEGVRCDCASTRDDRATNLVRGNLASLLDEGLLEPDMREVTVTEVWADVCVVGIPVQLGLLPCAVAGATPLFPASSLMFERGSTGCVHGNNALWVLPSCCGAREPVFRCDGSGVCEVGVTGVAWAAPAVPSAVLERRTTCW
jgi:hypothetical protein